MLTYVLVAICVAILVATYYVATYEKKIPVVKEKVKEKAVSVTQKVRDLFKPAGLTVTRKRVIVVKPAVQVTVTIHRPTHCNANGIRIDCVAYTIPAVTREVYETVTDQPESAKPNHQNGQKQKQGKK